MSSVFVVDRQNRTFISLHDTRAAPIQLTIAYIYSSNRISNIAVCRIMMLRDFSRTRCKSAALSLEFKSSLTSLNRLLGPIQYTLCVGRDGLVTSSLVRLPSIAMSVSVRLSVRQYISVRVVRRFILCDPIEPNPSADWPNPTHYKWKKLDPHQYKFL